MISVRLDPEIESLLNRLSQSKGLSKSTIIKEALAMYFQKESESLSPYELGVDLFGPAEGSPNSSMTYKAQLKRKLVGKYPH